MILQKNRNHELIYIIYIYIFTNSWLESKASFWSDSFLLIMSWPPPPMITCLPGRAVIYDLNTKPWLVGGQFKWVWVNTYRYIFSGMNIHLPAILMFTRGTRFWHTARCVLPSLNETWQWRIPFFLAHWLSQQPLHWAKARDFWAMVDQKEGFCCNHNLSRYPLVN